MRPSRKRHRYFAPNSPMGRYVTQPLTVTCRDFTDLREFLRTCRYVSDREQFGRDDYWMPPEVFERRRQGDCDDFALWTWRQVLGLGYPARFVCGRAGPYGDGHAWVTFERDGRVYLLESLRAWLGPTFPRLSTVRYHPRLSVTWDGRELQYFEHESAWEQLTLRDVLALTPEWVAYWLRSWPRVWSHRLRRYLSSFKRRV
jgi:Bacterial transglutaminase-like cysteine proteinase BTLCP